MPLDSTLLRLPSEATAAPRRPPRRASAPRRAQASDLLPRPRLFERRLIVLVGAVQLIDILHSMTGMPTGRSASPAVEAPTFAIPPCPEHRAARSTLDEGSAAMFGPDRPWGGFVTW